MIETKEILVREALKIFINEGYERSSISLIANRCGVTKGAIYHHFTNKDELFYSCIDLMSRDWETWLKNRIDTARDLKSFLRIFVEYDDYFDKSEFYSSTTNFYHLIFDVKARFPDERRRLVFGRFLGYRDDIKGLLKKAKDRGEIAATIDCSAMAVHIYLLLEGLILGFNLLGSVIEYKNVNNILHKNLWKLLRA